MEDLEWQNNSIGNLLRPALLRLSELSEAEAATLLADLQTMNLNDERPLWEILGLAIQVGTPWKQLRIAELKTLLALAVGDEDAIREGCDWIHHFADLAPARRLVYRCIESMLNVGDADSYRRALVLLYGTDTVRQAEALLDRSERFCGLEALGADMQGSAMPGKAMYRGEHDEHGARPASLLTPPSGTPRPSIRSCSLAWHCRCIPSPSRLRITHNSVSLPCSPRVTVQIRLPLVGRRWSFAKPGLRHRGGETGISGSEELALAVLGAQTCFASDPISRCLFWQCQRRTCKSLAGSTSSLPVSRRAAMLCNAPASSP